MIFCPHSELKWIHVGYVNYHISDHYLIQSCLA